MSQFRAQLLFGPTLAWNMLLGRWLKVRRWWDRIDDHVVIGALPFSRDVAGLYHEGVRGVVNTCHEYSGPIRRYEAMGIEQFRMRTIDFTHPQLHDVEAAIAFMESQAAQGHSIYVHCKAGRARSATVVLCWLIKRHRLSPAEGQQLLLQLRPHVNRRLTERPVVQAFWERYRVSDSVVPTPEVQESV